MIFPLSMPSFIKKNLYIILILLVATFLRSYKISSTPAINSDEAALAYNAYSLWETGKDEHGISWPLHFKSFGDFKPGGYVYLALPFVKILGLNTLAIRLPNLILSVVSIYFFYKLINLLSTKVLAYYSTIVLALSPWHIHFSRGAWESSTALSLTIIGLYLFYSYILNHKPAPQKAGSYIYLYFSVLFFSLSLYTYHSARLITPLIIVFLFIQNFKTLTNSKYLKNTIIAIILAIIIITPVASSFLNSGGATRFNGVGILADPGPIWRANELLNHHGQPITLINRIMHNKRILYLLSWLEKYTSHFTADFLFINGDEVARSKSVEIGQFYLFELPLFILGLYLFTKTKHLLLKNLTFFLLLITPLASSLTFQAPSALRSLSMVIPLSIFIGYGIDKTVPLLNRKPAPQKAGSYILFLVAYLYSLAYYLNSYFILYPKMYPLAWQYSFDQVIPIVEENKTKYENVYFTNKYDQPYILYLFYSQYNPNLLQPQIQLTRPDQFGFSTVSKIDNINFFIPPTEQIPQNSIIFASDEKVSLNINQIINFPNGQPAFKIYTK